MAIRNIILDQRAILTNFTPILTPHPLNKATMKIDHLAIWCDDIEQMRAFYTTYFDCTSNEKYHNPTKNFTSYFLSFDDGDCRIELMHRPDIDIEPFKRGFCKGIAHLDIEVGSHRKVDSMIAKLRADGYRVVGEARTTGDGYYEASILDPEANYVEISAKSGNSYVSSTNFK